MILPKQEFCQTKHIFAILPKLTRAIVRVTPAGIDFWVGHILAWWLIKSDINDISLKMIADYIDYCAIAEAFFPYHEASEQLFVEEWDKEDPEARS